VSIRANPVHAFRGVDLRTWIPMDPPYIRYCSGFANSTRKRYWGSPRLQERASGPVPPGSVPGRGSLEFPASGPATDPGCLPAWVARFRDLVVISPIPVSVPPSLSDPHPIKINRNNMLQSDFRSTGRGTNTALPITMISDDRLQLPGRHAFRVQGRGSRGPVAAPRQGEQPGEERLPRLQDRSRLRKWPLCFAIKL